MADGCGAKQKDDQIKENEKKIEQLEKQVKENQSAEKIKALEEEIEILKKENKTLKEEIEKLKGSNKCLEEKFETEKKEKNNMKQDMKTMKKELENTKRELKNLKLPEDEICITQLSTSLQKNMCKIVLRENFDVTLNNYASEIDNHIIKLIDDEVERNAATERWKELQSEIGWDPYWIRVIAPIRKERNEMAHPILTEEKIRNAKSNLIKKGKLSRNGVKAVDSLTKMWKKTNDKLSRGRQTATEPGKHVQENEECYAVQMAALVLSERFQHNVNDTYASKVSGGSDLRKAQATK